MRSRDVDNDPVAVDAERIERLLQSVAAAFNGDFSTPVPLVDEDDDFLEVEVGFNYLLEELALQRQELLEQRQQIEAQAAALVEALSTPIIEIWPGVLALPIIGQVDRDRAAHITQTLLTRVAADRAKYVILDLTGLDIIDTSTMSALLHMIGALGKLGSTCFVTGMRPAAAQQIAMLDIGTTRLRSFARVADALELVLRRHPRS